MTAKRTEAASKARHLNAIDAAHCHALAEIAPSAGEAYDLWRESRAIVVAIGGPYASLTSIGGAR